MDGVREALEIAFHDTRRSLKSAKGIALLTLYIGSFLLAGVGFVLATEKASETLREQLKEQHMPVDAVQLEQMGKTKLFESFAAGDQELAESLARTPSVVLFFFISALLFLPALVSLMGYDTISGDVQGRTIRYTLLRARRGSYVAGKFLGQALLLGVFTLATNVVLFVFAAIRVPDFDLGVGVLALLRYWSLAMIYGLAFIALATLASTLTRYPLLALLAAFGGLCVFGVLWLFGVSDGNLAFIANLSPYAHWGMLFSPHPGRLAGGIGIYVAFIAVLLGGAYAIVRGRDL